MNFSSSSSLSEWKTSESIDASQNEYFIDEENLNENKLYEFQMVSFSIYSKSLPSNTIKLKYASQTSSTRPHNIKSMFATSTNSPIFLRLVNISQLDIILIAIFIILVFIMVLCIVACVAYKRSSKSFKKSTSKNIKGKWKFWIRRSLLVFFQCIFNFQEIDEWGFHTSSGATTSFLSSASSSEKSFNLYKTKS